MNQGQPKVQPAAQAGSPGEAAGVGLEVGVLRSSDEAPVTGAERRRGTCSDVSRGTRPKAPQGDTLCGRKVPDADCCCGGNAKAEPNSESRIREIRPSGLMRGRSRTVIGPWPFNPSAPAYSTTGFPGNPKSGTYSILEKLLVMTRAEATVLMRRRKL